MSGYAHDLRQLRPPHVAAEPFALVENPLRRALDVLVLPVMLPRLSLSPLGVIILEVRKDEAGARRVSNLERALELAIGPRHNEETTRGVARAVLGEPAGEYDDLAAGLIEELSDALGAALGYEMEHPRTFAEMRLREIRASYAASA